MWWVGTNGYPVLWMGKVCFPLRLWIGSAPAQCWIRSVACRRLGAAGAGRWEVQPGRRLSTTEAGQEAASSSGVRGPEALAYQDACASPHASPSKTEAIIKDGKAPTASCCAEKQKQPGNITWNAKLAFPSPQMWPPSLQGLSLLSEDLFGVAKGSTARIAWQRPWAAQTARLLCPRLAQGPHVLGSHLGRGRCEDVHSSHHSWTSSTPTRLQTAQLIEGEGREWGWSSQQGSAFPSWQGCEHSLHHFLLCGPSTMTQQQIHCQCYAEQIYLLDQLRKFQAFF